MKKNELFGHEVKKNESSFLVALGFRLEMLFVVFVCWLFEAVLLDVSTIDTTGLSGKKNRRPVLIFLEIHMIPNNQSIAVACKGSRQNPSSRGIFAEVTSPLL